MLGHLKAFIITYFNCVLISLIETTWMSPPLPLQAAQPRSVQLPSAQRPSSSSRQLYQFPVVPPAAKEETEPPTEPGIHNPSI